MPKAMSMDIKPSESLGMLGGESEREREREREERERRGERGERDGELTTFR